MQMNDRVFQGEHFEELEFSQPKISVAKNVKFLRCLVSPGTCTVNRGAQLENVVFDDLDCGDALRMSSDSMLNHVTIRGTKPKSLIVQPDQKANPVQPHGIALDITEFRGEVCIIGLVRDSVRFNPQWHVAVDLSWKDRVDWGALGIGPFSLWRLYLKKLEVFGAESGVFSLPPRKHKTFAATIDEMRKLIEYGLDLELPAIAKN